MSNAEQSGSERNIKIGEDVNSSTIISGDGNVGVQGDRAIITISNYYYREDIKVAPVTPADINADDDLPCPYRGLFHFGPNDAEFFFGRDVFIEELIQATVKRNFIPVLGASGSGKSSVVLAGLVPKLQQQSAWKFTHFRPGDNPFHALAQALVPLYEPEKNATEQMYQARQLAEYFVNGSFPLKDVFTKIEHHYPNHRVLLIADQFEELYTLCNDEKTRTSFLDTLLAGFQSSSSGFQSPPVLVATMRADFLGNALSYPPFGDVLQNTDIKIRSMNHSELSQVIVKPAEKLGITFEAGLVERILNDVEDKPGNLPLLEFALTLLWQQRTGKQLSHTAYDAIGKVQGALARYADESYDKLSATEQEQVRRIFIQLVRPDEGTEDTLRLATKAELGEASWALVTKMADKRLVVTSRNAADQETVEVVHEALIRNWDKLRQWMEADRSFRAWQERLRVAIQQWNAAGRDEGALLRGKPLADAQEWLQKRPEELTAEQEYIKASLGLQEREKEKLSRQRKRTIVGLTGGLVGALGLAAIAGLGWWQATNAATNERIKALVFESQSLFALSGAEFNTPFYKRISTRFKDRPPKEQELEDAKESEFLFQLASLKAIKAGRELQHALGVETGTKFQVLGALQQIVGRQVEPTAFTLPECELFKRGPFSLTWSSDRKTIACVNYDETVRLWDGRTGKKTNVFRGDSEWVNDVQFSPDGKMVASGTVDGTVKLWERVTGKEIRALKGHLSQVEDIRFSPDGQIIAAANNDGTIILWEVATGRKLKTLPETVPGHSQNIFFSPNSQFLASVVYSYNDNILKLWEVSTGKELKTFRLKDSPHNIGFSSDSQTLAYSIGSLENQSVRFWSIAENRELRSISVPGKPFFSPDGKVIAVIDMENRDLSKGFTTDFTKHLVSLWDTSTGKKVKTLSNLPGVPAEINFSPDGSLIAIYTYDKDDSRLGPNHERNGKLTIWSRTGTKRKTIEQLGEFFQFNFSPDSQKIAVSSFGADAQGWHVILKLWDVSTGRQLKTLSDELIGFSPRGLSAGLDIRFSPDGQMIAAIGSSGIAKFFDSLTGAELNLPNVNPSRDIDRPPIISKDGNFSTTLRTDGSMRRRNRSTGEEIKLSRWDSVLVSAAHISDDGKTITTVNWYGKLQKRELATGQILKSTNLPFRKFASRLEFSPDGRTIAAAMSDNTVKIWDATTNKEIITLKGYASKADLAWVKDELHFSPDGTIVAALGSDYQGSYDKGGKLELWEVSTGKAIQFSEVPSGIKSISFSHTNDELAILKTDNTIQLWKLPTRQLLKTIRPLLNTINRIQFNHDSNLLFVLGSHELKMLNIKKDREIASLKLPPGSLVESIDFRTDGKTLVLQSGNQFTFLNFDLEDLLKRACNILPGYMKINPSGIENDCHSSY
jgi:WD40 repeat protein